MSLRIDFVILTWNSEKYIENCLNSIALLSPCYTPVVHIVENGSSDKTKSIILNKYPKVHLIELHKNIGTTRSRNMVLKQLGKDTDYICILDSDTIISETAITALIKGLMANESYGIAVPKMKNMEGLLQISCKRFPSLAIKLLKPMPIRYLETIGKNLESYDFRTDDSVFEVDYGISACWLIRNECFNKVGLLDEHIFYAPEDVDYCLRTWKTGYKVIYVPSSEIIHDTQRISRKKYFSKINYEHIKGLLYFFHKHGYWFRRPRFY